jgi:hypothetical protein
MFRSSWLVCWTLMFAAGLVGRADSATFDRSSSLARPSLLRAQAPAPTLESSLPCVSPATGAQLTGTGWTPSGQVRLRGRYLANGSEALDHTVTADVNGRIEFSSGLPDDDARRWKVEVTAEDVARPELRASVRFTISWFGPFFKPWNTNGPARGRPGKVSQIEASGYIQDIGSVLYAHYVLRDQQVATVRVGRLKGPCGSLKHRFRQFAFKDVRRGTYSVYFNTTSVFSDSTFDAPGYRRVVVR